MMEVRVLTRCLLVTTMVVLAVELTDASRKRVHNINKRDIEQAYDVHLRSPDLLRQKRDQNVQEPELMRMKRFKRDTEAELVRVKRVKRDADLELLRSKVSKNALEKELERQKRKADDSALIRVKRGRRDAEPELSRVKRQKREAGKDSDAALSRQKRFKRSSYGNRHLIKRANKHNLHQVKTHDNVKRSKRAELKKRQPFLKHPSRNHLREKRRHPLVIEKPLKSVKKNTHLATVVKKAMDTWRRGKRRMADGKHETESQLGRAKRSGKIKHTAVLKDIERDISRLQRLKKRTTHAVIRDVKRQNKLHHLKQRHE